MTSDATRIFSFFDMAKKTKSYSQVQATDQLEQLFKLYAKMTKK